jgi:hypothetical protein
MCIVSDRVILKVLEPSVEVCTSENGVVIIFQSFKLLIFGCVNELFLNLGQFLVIIL